MLSPTLFLFSLTAIPHLLIMTTTAPPMPPTVSTVILTTSSIPIAIPSIPHPIVKLAPTVSSSSDLKKKKLVDVSLLASNFSGVVTPSSLELSLVKALAYASPQMQAMFSGMGSLSLLWSPPGFCISRCALHPRYAVLPQKLVKENSMFNLSTFSSPSDKFWDNKLMVEEKLVVTEHVGLEAFDSDEGVAPATK